MASAIKSATYLQQNSKSLKEVKEAISNHNRVIERNTAELKKLNDHNTEIKEDDAKKLKTALKKLETQIQWVKNEEPAIKADAEHILKRLDIL